MRRQTSNHRSDAALATTAPHPFQSGWRTIKDYVANLVSALAQAGTQGYPPDTQRRLKIVNVISALIAVTTFVYAIHLWHAGDPAMMPVVYINLGLVLFVSLVPFAHRINDIAGGLLLVVAEFVALTFFCSFFGRDGGTPLQLVVVAAAPFVIYDRKRLPLIILIVIAAFTLHLFMWFSFPVGTGEKHFDQKLIDSLYVQGAITTFGLIAASVYYAFTLVERAKSETEDVLRNVLPDSVVERIKASPDTLIADSFPHATILFADITGFVGMARGLGPERTVAVLNKLVSVIDAKAAERGVEKIKTIGDAYMVAAGVPEPCADHRQRMANMALDILDIVAVVAREENLEINVRIGMASGPIMAGVIGTQKFTYDVWGDAVNLASRLEGQSQPGRILVCPSCHDALKEGFVLSDRGLIEIKGVGQQQAWFLEGRQQNVNNKHQPTYAP